MSAETNLHNVTATRHFDAPVATVWKAWSDPDKVKQWWGPTGFTVPVANMDFREGGTSLICMRSPDGQDFYNTWTYQKLVPAERIEFLLHFTDIEGNKLDPTQAGLPPGIPKEVPHIITFKALGDNKTEMTVTEIGYTTAQSAEISQMGLDQCLDKMEKLLASS